MPKRSVIAFTQPIAAFPSSRSTTWASSRSSPDAELRHELVELCLVAVGEREDRALLGESARHHRAETAGRTGDRDHA